MEPVPTCAGANITTTIRQSVVYFGVKIQREMTADLLWQGRELYVVIKSGVSLVYAGLTVMLPVEMMLVCMVTQ